MSLVIDLIDLVAKHKAGELRCPATALIMIIPTFLVRSPFYDNSSYLNCPSSVVFVNKNEQNSNPQTHSDRVQKHQFIKIFSGETPRSPLTRGGFSPLSCSPPTRAFGTRTCLPPDHFLNRGDGPAVCLSVCLSLLHPVPYCRTDINLRQLSFLKMFLVLVSLDVVLWAGIQLVIVLLLYH